MILIAECITGGGVLKAYRCSNVACIALLNILTVVTVHLKNTADTLAASLAGVVNGRACLKSSRIYTEEAELSDKGIGRDLKGKSSKRLAVRAVTLNFLVGAGIDSLNRGNIGGGGHIVNNSVEKLLNALVAVGCSANNRNHLIGDGGFADAFFDLGDGNLVTVEIFLKQFFVLLGNVFHHFLVIFLSNLFHIVGDIGNIDVGSQIVCVNVCLHFNKVDKTLEFILGAYGQLDGHSVALESGVHHIENMIEVGTHNVHLINIDHTGNLVFIGLAPYGFRLGLNAALSAKNRYRTVQHAERTLNFSGEVNVAGGVDDVDAILVLGIAGFPETGGSSRGNGYTSLLLLLHPVHGGGTVVNLTDLMVDSGIVKYALAGSCFTGVDMGHNANISGHFK